MASFETVTFTKKGMSLMSRIYLGSTLKFTKMSISSKVHDGTEEVQDIKQEFPICSFAYVDLDHLSIKAVGNNLELTTGYYARSIGIYADDPIFGEILFCYANADPADYVPPHKNNQGVTDLEFNIQFAIKDAEKVIVEVQETTFASKSDFDDAMNLRPVRYLMDTFPQLSKEDYWLDLICKDHDEIVSRIEALRAEEQIEILESEHGLFSLQVEDIESNIDHAKEHVSEIEEPKDIAIII